MKFIYQKIVSAYSSLNTLLASTQSSAIRKLRWILSLNAPHNDVQDCEQHVGGVGQVKGVDKNKWPAIDP